MSYGILDPTTDVFGGPNGDDALAEQYNSLRGEVHALMNGIPILPNGTNLTLTWSGYTLVGVASTNPNVSVVINYSGNKISTTVATFSDLRVIVTEIYTWSGDLLQEVDWTVVSF